MIIGFLLSIAAAFVWSLTNVIDKAILSKWIRSPLYQTFIFTITSFVFGLVVLPFTLGGVVGIDWIWLSMTSLLFLIGTWSYFVALKQEEPSRVVPLFSLSVVFVAVLSAIFLSEFFDLSKYLGIACIIIGSFIITSRKNIFSAFTSRSLGLMIVSSLSYAVAYVIIKHLLNTYSLWDIFSYQRLIIGIFSVCLLILFFPKIKEVYQRIKKKIIALSFTSEIIGEIGTLLFMAAIAAWFVTFVETVASVQYLFIFFWALIISRFKPSLFAEEVNKKIMLQKIVSIVLIIVGIYLIT